MMRLTKRPWRLSARRDAVPGTAASAAELQRRREGLIILCTAVAVLLFAFFETRLPQFSSGNSLSNNVIFFLLINLNIILLVLLVFLVARNLTKLVFERRRRMLGSHMRTRLVLAFLAVSIFPAVLIFLVALGFMTSSIENWFNVQVENSLAGSLEIARSYYAHASQNALHHARELAEHVGRERLVSGDADERLAAYVTAKQREYNVGTVEVYGVDRQRRAVALADEVPPQVTIGRTSSLLTAALEGRSDTRIQSIGEGDVIRAAVPIAGASGTAGAVVVDYFVPQSVANRSAEIARSFQEYRQLKIMKQPITSNYVVTLILVTLLVIFCATWMGFYLAKGITVPIQKLAEGTREVAQGNWQYRIGLGDGTSIAADDEFGSLVGSFNQMTADLEMINLELEKRRRYMETILATMTGGVISLDQEGRVTTINEAAERLLGLDGPTVLGRDVAEVFARPDLNTARELMQELHHDAGRAAAGARAHRQLKLVTGGRVLTIVLTATLLRDDAGQSIGAVLFFEDVTEIVKVQRMEAWREVARRIAHEIKNPLTPIQLSAQRLHKRYADKLRVEVNMDGSGPAEKTGTLWVDNFRILGDPVVSEVFSGAESGPGTKGKKRQVVRQVFEFDRMVVPFSVGYGQFVMNKSYLRGPLLGASIAGKVDFKSRRVNLGGTYVPLQGLQALPLCAIPIVGAIITGPDCEGVSGITFAIQGPMDRPEVIVNPLAMLAPGIFREIFQMTNPNQKVQRRDEAPSPDAGKNTRSSSTSVEAPPKEKERKSGAVVGDTIDGWSSQTIESMPTRKE